MATAISMSLSRYITCQGVCVQHTHATKRLVPQYKVNICGFVATVLLRNNDQQQNNPLATFTTRLCGQRKRHEWTASPSLHDTVTVNLTLVQCELHTRKKLPLQESNQLIGIYDADFSFFGKYLVHIPNFQGGETGICPPCERPCNHWLFYIRFHKQGQLI